MADSPLDRLCVEYGEWNISQGLSLGSADEHTLDENLTAEQRAWLVDFCARWEAGVAQEREAFLKPEGQS